MAYRRTSLGMVDQAKIVHENRCRRCEGFFSKDSLIPVKGHEGKFTTRDEYPEIFYCPQTYRVISERMVQSSKSRQYTTKILVCEDCLRFSDVVIPGRRKAIPDVNLERASPEATRWCAWASDHVKRSNKGNKRSSRKPRRGSRR